MPGPTASAISSELPRWLREVTLGNQTVDVEKLRTGLAQAREDLNAKQDVEALARLALGSKAVPDAAIAARFVARFQEVDNSLELRVGDRLLEILAASLLVDVMGGEEHAMAGYVALACATAMSVGRKTNLPMDLASAAEDALDALGDTRRVPIGSEQKGVPKLDLGLAIEKVKSAVDVSTVTEALQLVGQQVTNGLKQLETRQRIALRRVESAFTCLEEEIQMLWWLVGGRSWLLDAEFDELDGDAAPLILAYDLAEMTNEFPGPRSIKALISRARRGGARTSIAGAVNALGPVASEKLAPTSGASPVTTPIHLAIQRQRETGDSESWVAGWSGATELPSDAEHSVLDVATSFYRERLFLAFDE